jgi:hypothetical protein
MYGSRPSRTVSRMRRSLVVAVAAVLVGMVTLASGCSGAGPNGSTGSTGSGASPTSQADVLAVWRDFAACARTHGVPNLPDPRINADGKVEFAGFDERAEPDSVRQGCQQILDRLPADSRASAARTDIAGLLRFATCMRQHGFPDWPDPKANGTFPAAQLPNQKTPALISAMQACDALNPDRGGHVYGS